MSAEKIAFAMQLLPGKADEYRKRHDEIWPELAHLLRTAGIHDYSIYLDERSHTLFAVLRRGSAHTMADLPKDPIMRRWWDHMRDIMETQPDGKPVVTELTPMFHLD